MVDVTQPHNRNKTLTLDELSTETRKRGFEQLFTPRRKGSNATWAAVCIRKPHRHPVRQRGSDAPKSMDQVVPEGTDVTQGRPKVKVINFITLAQVL